MPWIHTNEWNEAFSMDVKRTFVSLEGVGLAFRRGIGIFPQPLAGRGGGRLWQVQASVSASLNPNSRNREEPGQEVLCWQAKVAANCQWMWPPSSLSMRYHSWFFHCHHRPTSLFSRRLPSRVCDGLPCYHRRTDCCATLHRQRSSTPRGL